MNEFLSQVEPYLVDLAVAVVIALIGIAGALLLKVKELIIAKIGASRFDQAMRAANGIWFWIRDNHPEWTGQQKIEEMQNQLLQKFPTLTQVELDSINKQVHEVLKPITQTIEG